MTVRPFLCALALGAAIAQTAFAASDAREVHGVADAFARHGVALAWGVLRGSTEADTVVVVRIESSTPDYAFVSAEGVDPFTQQRSTLQPATRAAGGVELRFPRGRFAEFPRTEFRFAPDEKTAATLTVYYLGVPDTTPEFASQEALARYLADRLARERATGVGTPK
jgi:hypothetical protein